MSASELVEQIEALPERERAEVIEQLTRVRRNGCLKLRWKNLRIILLTGKFFVTKNVLLK